MPTRAPGVDWGAIWSGALVSLGLLCWLGAMSLALDWWALAPEAPRGAPLGTPAATALGLVWTALAFGVGGWLSAHRAPMAPRTHGLLVGVLATVLSLISGALGIGGIVGSLMGPLNLQVYAQRALQGLNGPAAIATAAGGLAGWFAATALVALVAAWVGAWWAGRALLAGGRTVAPAAR